MHFHASRLIALRGGDRNEDTPTSENKGDVLTGGFDFGEGPSGNGISISRSMNLELGFGVCLYRTKIILGLPAKPLPIGNRALKVINGILNFYIFLTQTLTLTLTLYTKNTVT